MFPSFYTHVALVISCVIFSLSLFSFIKRHDYLFQSTQISIGNIDQFQIHAPNIRNKRLLDISNEQTNEKILREKVLGSNKTLPSILHRFTFINPPRPVCIYPKDTKHFMIIIVLSRGLNFDYRQAIRATWGRNGKYKKNNIYLQTIFFVGTDDNVQLAIRDEQAIFNDVIEIGNFLFTLSGSKNRCSQMILIDLADISDHTSFQTTV
jgi:hypothetical protein